MNIIELNSHLRAWPDHMVSILLPDGSRVPPHYHVTEIGHVAKKFVDCGGTFRMAEACVLQTLAGSDGHHRLTAGKLAHILDLAKSILPSADLPVEVEYEDGVISQYPLHEVTVDGASLTLHLGLKHTDCLAKEKCGMDGGCCVDEETSKRRGEAEACCADADAGQGCC
jgi:hypothetical protein